MGKNEKVFFLFLPLATKLGATFTSFHLLLLKKVNSDHLEFFFKRIIFNSNLENIESHNLFEEKKMIRLRNGIKKESRINVWRSVEKLEVSKDSVESLKS